MPQCGWTSKTLYQAREASHRRTNQYDSIQRKCLKQLKSQKQSGKAVAGARGKHGKSCLTSEEFQVHKMKRFSHLSHSTVNIYNNIELHT